MPPAPVPGSHSPRRAAREVARSFVYAFEGLLYTVYTQRNMRFHLFVAILALATATAFRVDAFEKMVLTVVVCLVPAFEIINTSVESHADFTGEHHELIKRAKDTAAGAVLVMALCSMAIGGYILIPRLVTSSKAPPPPPGVLITLVGFRLVLMLAVWGCLLFFWGLPLLPPRLLPRAGALLGRDGDLADLAVHQRPRPGVLGGDALHLLAPAQRLRPRRVRGAHRQELVPRGPALRGPGLQADHPGDDAGDDPGRADRLVVAARLPGAGQPDHALRRRGPRAVAHFFVESRPAIR